MPEAATGGVLCKRVFSKISENSQENTCARVSVLIKLQASGNRFYRTTPDECFWNAYIAKTRREKLIAFVAERWMQCLLLRLKSQSAREACHQTAFMGICLTISHKCKHHLPIRWVFLLIPVVAERNKEAGWIFLFLVLILWNEKGMWVQDFLLSP